MAFCPRHHRTAPWLALLTATLVGTPPAASAAASPLADCPASDAALLIALDGDWPAGTRVALEAQIAVEAQRLQLTACRATTSASVPSPRAAVRATLDADAIRVEVTATSSATTRRFERTVSRARLGSPALEAELAFVIGELAREALRAAPLPLASPPPVAPPPPPPDPVARGRAPAPEEGDGPVSWALGARAATELFPAHGTTFLGLDAYLRRRVLDRLRVELSATGRLSLAGSSALGSARAQAVGGGAALGYPVGVGESASLSVELGLRAAALRLDAAADATTGATADPARWDLQLHAHAGLELDYRLGPRAPLVLRAGGVMGLRGVAVRAADEVVISSQGAGLFVSLGGEGWF